ncbi:MAG: PDZ domain-containing protein [bacterium]|nr:PDZ domain-containing protein [bacterium]
METRDDQPFNLSEPTLRPNLPPAPPQPPAPAPAMDPVDSATGKGYWRWYFAAVLLALAVAVGAAFAIPSDSNASATPAIAITESTDAIESPARRVTPTTPPTTATPLPSVATDRLSTLLLDASLVGSEVIPSVVTVQISSTAFNGEEGRLGSGSGVVYDNQGHIITNNHVVEAGSNFEIVLSDGRVYPAELVGTDPTTDLAVLFVTAQDLEAVSLGDSDALTVGDPAVAIGSPLGLDGGPSLTVGVISAFGRLVQTDETTNLFGMLQTDAPITSGSSGGALVDGAGRLVGITTAVGVSDVGIEGIGFATPVEVVTRVADEIIADGGASSPYIGIRGETGFSDTNDGGSAPIGVLIESVEPETAAALAGLAEGDIISAINGATIETMNELVAQLRRYGAGDTIEVSLEGGSVIKVTLGQRPGV